jgi:molybdate transport system substrate-binding protein
LKVRVSFLAPTLLLIAMLAGCQQGPAGGVPATQAPQPRTLTVFAAASLTDAFSEIGRMFETEHPGVTVQFSFAGSQNLRTQIEQGAAADVFASANSAEMNALVDGELVQQSAPQTFATNQLLVVMPADNPAGITSLQDLAKPGLKLVLAAEEVPAGKYARQVLDNLSAAFGADYPAGVLTNVVSDELDVRQVVAKVQLGEADAGMVYVTDAAAAPELQTLAIPADVNVVAQYPIAALSESRNADLARAFIQYVLSAEGQATLRNGGFMPVTP